MKKKIKEVYHALSSMKTGLISLGLMGFTAAVGSWLFPQTFAETVLFKALILTLFLNISLCTANQLIRFGTGINKRKYKHWFRPLAILILHLGVVFILSGGIVYSLYGEKDQIKLYKGEAVDVSTILHTQKPFVIRLEEFFIEFNPDGSPSQYFSDISLSQGSKFIEQDRISVNNPFTYEDVKFYQKAFGYLIEVQGQSDSGWADKKVLQEEETFAIPNTNRYIQIYKYVPSYDPKLGMKSSSLRPDNPKVVYTIYQENALLKVGAASLGEKVEVQPDITVQFNSVQLYSILEAKRDPGSPFVLIGGIMLILGLCLSFSRWRKNSYDKKT